MTGGPASARLVVLAGTNGAGKSSVAGAALREAGAEYFNPDEATRDLLADNPGLSLARANSIVWHHGRDQLVRAIDQKLRFAFETTLGGNTITRILRAATRDGAEVRVWYVGLATVEQHIARVAARVARGGHDIPEDLIRRRYDNSRRHLIELLPHLAELQLWDNSPDADPVAGVPPTPLRVLHVRSARILQCLPPAQVPTWAKPIVQTALVGP